ncbi:MAG: hypothetical protein HOH43_20375 [Candidatus Latescibacteria bacterium]|jgi:hypothetical protein|nr:hypothetical protein [Candidatus Latescibacterota bacterium]
MQSRLYLSLTVGVRAPDVSQFEIRATPRYAVAGMLTYLMAIVERYRDRFPEPFWANCEYNGRIYYKREVFQYDSVEADSIERGDYYIRVGQYILKASGGKARMLPLSTGRLENMFQIMMQQNEVQVFDETGRLAVRSRCDEKTESIV